MAQDGSFRSKIAAGGRQVYLKHQWPEIARLTIELYRRIFIPMKVLLYHQYSNTRSTGMARMMHFLRDEALKSNWHLDLLFAEDVPCGFFLKALETIVLPVFSFLPVPALTPEGKI